MNMFNQVAKSLVSKAFAKVDIQIHGSRPWDLKVNDERFYMKLLIKGPLGFGEAFVDDWIECDRFDECLTRILKLESKNHPVMMWSWLRAYFTDLSSKKRGKIGSAIHYNFEKLIYEKMLDKAMTYSIGYWGENDDLERAQEKKLDLICRKLHLEPGMRVLDIGCGWGSFAQYATRMYNVSVVGINIAEKQIELAQQKYSHLPIEFRVQDYRDLKGNFDRIVSIGMAEHVGLKNYKRYLKIIRDCLKDEGLCLIEISTNTAMGSLARAMDPWFMRYFFPTAWLPTLCQFTCAADGLLLLEDLHNITENSEKTFLAWWDNLNKNWASLQNEIDHRTYLMFKYYLLSSVGAFRGGVARYWQLVFSKGDLPHEYRCAR